MSGKIREITCPCCSDNLISIFQKKLPVADVVFLSSDLFGSCKPGSGGLDGWAG